MGGGGASGAGLDKTGQASLWVGFAFMVLSTGYFTRASYHSHSKHVLYHFITSIVTLIAALAYLLMALESHGYGGYYDITWVHYADWVVTTPLLLIDLGMLAGMRVAEVMFLSVCDAVMVGAGFAGISTDDPAATWPFFAFGFFMFIIIVVRLIQQLHKLARDDPSSAESRAFRFLSVWTMVLWAVYPLLFVLVKTHVMDLNTETIIYVILDILAKCVFGAILVGSREVLEGESTPLALLAMAATGVNPSLHRRSSLSMSPDQMAAFAEYMKSIPKGPGGPNTPHSRRGSSSNGDTVDPSSQSGGSISDNNRDVHNKAGPSVVAIDINDAQGKVFSKVERVPQSSLSSPGGAGFSGSTALVNYNNAGSTPGGQGIAMSNMNGGVGAMNMISPVNGGMNMMMPNPAIMNDPANTSALNNLLQSLLAQQKASNGRDPAINAQVKAISEALAASQAQSNAAARGYGSSAGASTPGGGSNNASRRASLNGGIMASLLGQAPPNNALVSPAGAAMMSPPGSMAGK